MRFTALRLAGFKSFVEPAELRIQPGLTGIVGPNGCGKSNLLEALRWVMGAGSAKALRGGGMDDVIFAGAGERPARNLAEVSLAIDNTVGDGPPAFADKPWIEVTRRIDRGAGSSYRINGEEARARDVQLLFADASSGANSPALVRQGQISELIAAAPRNRRRVLEEAAGVAGLQGRRHEAELKLAAAEANLAKLDMVAREMDGQLARLKREARQAARYRLLSAEIRAAREAEAWNAWAEARSLADRARVEHDAAFRAEAETAGAAAAASATALEVEAALPPLREEAAVAAAVLHRLDIERDRLERAAESGARDLERLARDAARLRDDDAREARLAEDAAAASGQLRGEIAELDADLSAGPAELTRLAGHAAELERRRASAEAAVETLAADRAAARAASDALALRAREARARLERTRRQLDAARSSYASAPPADTGAGEADTRVEETEAALAATRAALEAVDGEREAAAAAEAAALAVLRAEASRLAALEAETIGLRRLIAPSDAAAMGRPALAEIAVEPGLEAAVAAALGDEAQASLDPAGVSCWRGAAAAPIDWPAGAEPIAGRVSAPPALAARLARIAVVALADGERLQAKLPPGARLVSREGDLWRWDGFVATAAAPRPAQVRLEQAGRLRRLAGEIEVARACAEAAHSSHAAASTTLAKVEATLAKARHGAREAEGRLAKFRQHRDELRSEAVRREARLVTLAENLARLEAEEADFAAQVAAIDRESSAAPSPPVEDGALGEARRVAAEGRAEAQAARGAHQAASARAEAAKRRRAAALGELSDWSRRAAATAERRAGLAAAAERIAAERALAEATPARLAGQLNALLEEYGLAEARRDRASDALAEAESARVDANRTARAAEARAAQAREARAAAVARLAAARERLETVAGEYERLTGAAPSAGEVRDGPPRPANSAGLAGLERERDGLGAVNLLAETEAADLAARAGDLAAERDDLEGALRRLRGAIGEIDHEARGRLAEAFAVVDGHFRSLFTTLFQGGEARLALVDAEGADDPLNAGLEIYACPPGKRMAVMSLMSGGEQALTAVALIFAVFLANPAPLCVLDEVDAPLDDANTERFCDLLDDMRHRAATRFLVITHNPLTMSRMDRLYGVTMRERGVSQLVSVDLGEAEALATR